MAPYTSGNLVNCKRNDLQYTVSVRLGYTFNKHVSAGLTYAIDLGRNAEDSLTAAQIQEREYDHQIITFGCNASSKTQRRL